MLSYAARELANKVTYPWSLQLIRYRRMLERLPPPARRLGPRAGND